MRNLDSLSIVCDMTIMHQTEHVTYEHVTHPRCFNRYARDNNSESNQMCNMAFFNHTCEYPNFPNDTDAAMFEILLKKYNESQSVAAEFPDFPV